MPPERDVLADRHFAVLHSYQACCGDEDFFDRFYRRLTAADERLRAMFADTDMQRQTRLLQHAIGALIQFAKGSQYGSDAITELTASHARDGHDAHPALYPLWIESLMATIAEADPDFDAELDAQWRAVLAIGTVVMIAGYATGTASGSGLAVPQPR